MLAFREFHSLLGFLTGLVWSAQLAGLLQRDLPFVPYLQAWYHRLKDASAVSLLRHLNAEAERDVTLWLPTKGQATEELPATAWQRWQRWCCQLFHMCTGLTVLSDQTVGAQPLVSIMHVTTRATPQLLHLSEQQGCAAQGVGMAVLVITFCGMRLAGLHPGPGPGAAQQQQLEPADAATEPGALLRMCPFLQSGSRAGI
jgi:hypothetical protein